MSSAGHCPGRRWLACSGDAAALPPAEALATAQHLLDEGMPFHAHEILEAAWKAAPPAERDLWQGLAQVAVGLTHALRGNARGAVDVAGPRSRPAGALSGARPAWRRRCRSHADVMNWRPGSTAVWPGPPESEGTADPAAGRHAAARRLASSLSGVRPARPGYCRVIQMYELAARIDSTGLTGIQETDLRLRLVSSHDQD